MSESLKRRLNAIKGQNDAYHLRKLLEATRTDLTNLRTTVAALVVDVTALRGKVANLVTDNTNRVANHNTLIAKLNLDGGVTDADYAAATAAVSTAPAAVTSAEPSALTMTE